MEMIIVIIYLYFFNSVIFQVKEDEEEGLRHNTNQSPRQLSIFTQPRAVLFLSMLIEIHQSYQNLLQAVLSLVVVHAVRVLSVSQVLSVEPGVIRKHIKKIRSSHVNLIQAQSRWQALDRHPLVV